MNVRDLIDGMGIITRLTPKVWIKHNAPRVRCADGAILSVQASKSHYCLPRDNHGPYTAVEVGYPSPAPPESWNEFADSTPGGRVGGIYSYVPVELVYEFIEAHGGEVQEGQVHLDCDAGVMSRRCSDLTWKEVPTVVADKYWRCGFCRNIHPEDTLTCTPGCGGSRDDRQR